MGRRYNVRAKREHCPAECHLGMTSALLPLPCQGTELELIQNEMHGRLECSHFTILILQIVKLELIFSGFSAWQICPGTSKFFYRPYTESGVELMISSLPALPGYNYELLQIMTAILTIREYTLLHYPSLSLQLQAGEAFPSPFDMTCQPNELHAACCITVLDILLLPWAAPSAKYVMWAPGNEVDEVHQIVSRIVTNEFS